jgi:hypothetical protein
VYKQGSENRVADVLSRKPQAEVFYHAVFVCQPKWLDEVGSSYEVDQYSKDIITKLAIDSIAVPNFS